MSNSGPHTPFELEADIPINTRDPSQSLRLRVRATLATLDEVDAFYRHMAQLADERPREEARVG